MTVEVSEALSRLAVRLGGAGARLGPAQRLSGGASMETWAFEIDGPAGHEALILRRRTAPYDPETARSVTLATEAALIQATGANGAPVPPVRHICDAADGLGEAYIMGRVGGETLGKRIVSDPRFDAVRGKLARQCGEVLVPIHATTPPPGLNLKTSDGLGELDRYEEVYRATEAQRPILDLAFQYLRKHLPEPAEPVLLHGDFRNGNIMFHPELGVAAVLDWELAHIGDPAEDMGWICTNS
ncbi:MAG: phosphotransferase family protein, partial [Phenylobacterium sp.]